MMCPVEHYSPTSQWSDRTDTHDQTHFVCVCGSARVCALYVASPEMIVRAKTLYLLHSGRFSVVRTMCGAWPCCVSERRRAWVRVQSHMRVMCVCIT